MKISFIGTGLMGFPMAKNLLKKNLDLKIFSRTLDKSKPLEEFGGKIINSLSEAIIDSDIILTMLTDDDAVEKVLGNSDFLKNLKPSSTVIDMSSIKPKIAIKYGKLLKENNINFLDAPVSGGTIGAEQGSLAIMVGGDQKTFDNAIDVLKIMGNPTLVGPIGSGQVSKLANQIIVGVTIGAVAEAITLCEKAGVDGNKFIKALSGGFADGKILQNHGKRMIKKDFSPKGKVSTHLKDMNNILECANDFNTQLPISNLIQSMFKSLVDNGNSDDDHSALYKEIENLNKSQ
ncbi:NAD(P)-dependent oxidoreductase [Candidatus Pelagibacter sp.]|jgi:2-hydroxy-3-oxopropionate reductase|nr:NAD(P)-dependent oxidoreductase [Candidatus Pelagibacter bacterium]MDB3886317.1 NAD(P)-dependent oxidoreductase [Candidatus Pelagibacter sp.]MDB3904621.1 NAD(P)-dependent oxidoreductase [Candidatus Pelagibacter sp.]MDC0397597.1 NAD(P)-dependent oxidoreductase [Candidatus Pelagibacter sp.]MDC0997351.1 NAD(P)-dependent oxidoreductase [Candidatus Pelagibacter sp.]|tara:strand:- start:417 stop:1286 length:870 start_codon:yes stop_codon:yes gene_type:complete